MHFPTEQRQLLEVSPRKSDIRIKAVGAAFDEICDGHV
jgi:hypothetical protein